MSAPRKVSSSLAYYRRNAAKINAKKVAARSTPEARIQTSLQNIKCRAKRKGLPYTIALEDLLPLPAACPILGIPLDYGVSGKKARARDNSASVDRVDSSQGYVPGNVRVISNRANRLRNNGTSAELIRLAVDALQLEEAARVRAALQG